MSDLMDKLLKVSTAPTIPRSAPPESRRVAEFSESTGSIEVPEDAPEGKALDFLKAANQDPADWEVTGFKRSEWGDPENPFVSTRFTFKRRQGLAQSDREAAVLEVLAWIARHKPRTAPLPEPVRDVAVLAIGDLQLGKLENLSTDSDLDAAAANAIDVIDQFVADLRARPAREVLVSWLGDHGEGFVSQGGANVWRTQMTQADQNRIMRRIMYYAVDNIAPWVGRLVMTAVPGNHGESQRVAGRGVTRYDDNNDTEQLNAVAEGVARSGADFDHVEFYVPERDEVSLTVDVGGIPFGAVHGNDWSNPNKFADWWAGQVVHDGPTARALVLLCGHYHHLIVTDVGRKLFVQTPALERGSQWWKNKTGIVGHPGAVLLEGINGQITNIKPLRAKESA